MTGGRSPVRYLGLVLAIAAVGVASAVFVLLKQGAPSPVGDSYDIKVELERANGVRPGVGQPVTVAGVKVGSINGLERRDGRALVTMAINRDDLAVVRRDARATLTPISPLNDMQIVLDPGTRRAPAMPEGATIPLAASDSPLPPSAILGSLDTDTRQFLTSMLAALDRGTRGNGDRIRRAVATLGPVAGQTRELTEVLAARRRSLSRLVSNLGVVAEAAADDGQLAEVVRAGDATLGALASRDVALRGTVEGLPRTLAHVRTSLDRAASFSRELSPTLDRLTPVARRLPSALRGLAALSRTATPVLRRDVRPLTRELQPLLREARPAVSGLTDLAPQLTWIGRNLRYALNVIAFNPPGEADEGGLYWLAWFAHNWNSAFSTADAHGSIGRIQVLSSCEQAQALGDFGLVFQTLFNVPGAC